LVFENHHPAGERQASRLVSFCVGGPVSVISPKSRFEIRTNDHFIIGFLQRRLAAAHI
jgi:hypothetical protein